MPTTENGKHEAHNPSTLNTIKMYVYCRNRLSRTINSGYRQSDSLESDKEIGLVLARVAQNNERPCKLHNHACKYDIRRVGRHLSPTKLLTAPATTAALTRAPVLASWVVRPTALVTIDSRQSPLYIDLYNRLSACRRHAA